jgi:hypothetical protein
MILPEMDTEVWDKEKVCRFFGGTRPINPASLYRGIKVGRYPKPSGRNRRHAYRRKGTTVAWLPLTMAVSRSAQSSRARRFSAS